MKKVDIENKIKKLEEEINNREEEIEKYESIKEKEENVFEKLEDLYRVIVFNLKKIILNYSDLIKFTPHTSIYSKINFYKEKQLYFDEKYVNTSEQLRGIENVYFWSYLRLNNQLYEHYLNIRNQVVHDNPDKKFDLEEFEQEIKIKIYNKMRENLDKAIKSIGFDQSNSTKISSDKDKYFKDSYEILGDLHVHKALLIRKFEPHEVKDVVNEAKTAFENYNKAIAYGKNLEEQGITYYSYKADGYMEIFTNFFYEDKLGNLEKISNLVDKRNLIEKKFKIWEKLAQSRFDNKPIRGMKDFFPRDLRETNWILSIVEEIADLYSYDEFEGPILEPIEIFAAKSSHELVYDQSFYVEKIADKKIILRPELTPTLARMISQKSQEFKKPIRWFSVPTCFRYEQPQRGRLRSFKQVNFDILGEDSLYAELEIFNIAIDILTSFGATAEHFQIYYNNRRFVDAFCELILEIPKDKMTEVYKILDKAEKMEESEVEKWLIDTFDNDYIVQGIFKFKESKDLKELLAKFENIPEEFYNSQGYKELIKLNELINEVELDDFCSFAPQIVRGLDYYTGTVFEVFDTGKENIRAIFGGGRYDDLLSLFSDDKLSGMGFGMGTLMLSLFLKTYNLIPDEIYEKDYSDTIYIASINEKVSSYALGLATIIREEFPCIIDYRFKNLKSQLSKANELGIFISLIVGPKEMDQNQVSLKNMKTEEQKTVNVDKLIDEIYKILDEIDENIEP